MGEGTWTNVCVDARTGTGGFRAASLERYEVIIDFSKYPIGKRVVLQNRSNKNNRDYTNTNKVMAFDVVGEATDLSNNEIPAVLNPNETTMNLLPAQSVKTRKFSFERQHGEWTINGYTWKDVERSNYKLTLANPKRGDVEIWEFQNKSGGWFHPVHVHLIDFTILDRNGKPPLPDETGPKDVVYVGLVDRLSRADDFRQIDRGAAADSYIRPSNQFASDPTAWRRPCPPAPCCSSKGMNPTLPDRLW